MTWTCSPRCAKPAPKPKVCSPSPASGAKPAARKSSWPARARRCSSASARRRTSSPPTRPPCSPTPARWFSSKTATSPSCSPTATAFGTATGNASSGRYSGSTGTSCRSKRAATNTSCGRKSTSSRRPCRTPWPAASTSSGARWCSAAASTCRRKSCAGCSTSTSWLVAPPGIRRWSANSSSRSWRGCRFRSTMAPNTATATRS